MVRAVGVSLGVLVASTVPGTAAAAAPADEGGERIAAYNVTLSPRADGSLQVVERITYNFGTAQRHGIVRDIVNRQRYDSGRDRVFPVHDVTVSSPTAPAQFTTTESGGQVHVKIGDPNATVTGRQDYTIGYTVLAATTRQSDHDELYWNAVGPGWTVQVDSATVTVTAPAAIQAATCYAGPVGSGARCPVATKAGNTATYRAGPLAPQQALTVVAALPLGSVATAAPVLTDRLTPRRFMMREPWTLGAAGGIVALAVLVLLARRRRAKAEQAELAAAVPPVGYPETAPPDGIAPGLAGVLVAERAQRPHVIATLTDLAGRGYLAIEPQGPREWRLRALRGPDTGLQSWERALLDGIFARSSDVLLSELRASLGKVLRAVEWQLRNEAVGRGWLRRRPSRGTPYGVVGCLAFLAGIPLIGALGVAAGAGAVGIAVLIAGVVLLLAALVRRPRLTPAGAAMQARVRGFQGWLGSLYPTGQPPADQEAMLRRLLPYAVAFGFAPLMVQAFAPVLATAGVGYLYYNDINTFSSDVDRTGNWSSSSSSGGSSSGFSGGSSGGGGGGGGGSSW